jgi:hypothetical protein
MGRCPPLIILASILYGGVSTLDQESSLSLGLSRIGKGGKQREYNAGNGQGGKQREHKVGHRELRETERILQRTIW